VNRLLTQIAKFTTENAPTILASAGVVGVVTTAVLAGKGGFKAAQLIRDEEEFRQEVLETKEKAQLTWQCYIPATGTGVLTVAAVLGGMFISNRRIGAAAAAFTLTERAFAEYREKATEMLGPKKEARLVDEVAKKRVEETPKPNSLIVMAGKWPVLESYSGQWFESTMEDLKKAENDFNHKLLREDMCSLSDYYNLLGIPTNGFSDNVGWRSDEIVDIQITTTVTDDQRPAFVITFRNPPKPNFHKYG
jgi:hypothetical protein